MDNFSKTASFKPLHMSDTLAYRNGKNTVPNRAYGHSAKAGEFVEGDQSSTSATLGDGGVYSNLADLAKWDAALQNHTLLGKEEMNAALTPVKLAERRADLLAFDTGRRQPESRQAGGLRLRLVSRSLSRPDRMWHTGSTRGFHTVIERFPDEKLTVIVLCNRTDLDAAALALQAADVFLKSSN